MSGVISGQGKIVRAVQNLRYLLNQGYPRESAVNFVANHYRFPLNQRHLLARCVFSKIEIVEHRRKAIRAGAVRGKRLGVDGYNVLITLESIFTRKQVVRCGDGYIRDLRAIFGKYRISPATTRALAELLRIIARAKSSHVEFLFDKQVSRSGELAGMVRQRLKQAGLKGDAQAIGGVDLKLRSFDVVASGDRAIIRRARAIWDIPAELLKRKKVKVFDLKKF
ncbi:hypothetical protein ES703_04533 [subsurface metagenome]